MKIQKKFLTFLAALTLFAGYGMAAKTPVPVSAYRKYKLGNTTGFKRVPAQMDISISYDEDTRLIEVEVGDNLTGEVFMFDSSDNQIGYSSVVNCTFVVPQPLEDWVIIQIEGPDWGAEAGVAL